MTETSLAWDYPTCYANTKQLVSNHLGAHFWISDLKPFFEQYQCKQLYVPQRSLFQQWDFICHLRKTLKRTQHWAVQQCLQPNDFVVLNSFMFYPTRLHLYWLFFQTKDHYNHILLVKHMICSMNSMLKHLIHIRFPTDHVFYFNFQTNLALWFTSFSIKRISFDLH